MIRQISFLLLTGVTLFSLLQATACKKEQQTVLVTDTVIVNVRDTVYAPSHSDVYMGTLDKDLFGTLSKHDSAYITLRYFGQDSAQVEIRENSRSLPTYYGSLYQFTTQWTINSKDSLFLTCMWMAGKTYYEFEGRKIR